MESQKIGNISPPFHLVSPCLTKIISVIWASSLWTQDIFCASARSFLSETNMAPKPKRMVANPMTKPK